MMPNPKRNLSSRNTHWNGRVQLLYDHHEHTKADYRWQGHVNNGTDTPTSADTTMFDIQSKGFKELSEFLEFAGVNMNLAAEDAVAKTAAEGRKFATEVEERKFKFGKRWEHKGSSYDNEIGRRTHHWESTSEKNPSLGGYVGLNSSGNEIRLINFHFVKGHTYKDLKNLSGTIEAKVTSQMANLFENDAHWRAVSPKWRLAGTDTWYGFGKDHTRGGKHYFGELYNAFGRGLEVGIEKAKESFDRRMNGTY